MQRRTDHHPRRANRAKVGRNHRPPINRRQIRRGQPLQAWVDFATVWADVRFVSGIETIKAGREISTSRASVRIRRRANVSRQMRARIDGVEYDILGIIPSADRAWLTLICEVVA